MNRDRLMRVIGAQTTALDYAVAAFNAMGKTPPREFVAALIEIQRIADEPAVNLAQNLVTMQWEVEA